MSKSISSGGTESSVKYAQEAADDNDKYGGKIMNSIDQNIDLTAKFQSHMGLVQSLVKMNEANAKVTKGVGTAVAGLA